MMNITNLYHANFNNNSHNTPQYTKGYYTFKRNMDSKGYYQEDSKYSSDESMMMATSTNTHDDKYHSSPRLFDDENEGSPRIITLIEEEDEEDIEEETESDAKSSSTRTRNKAGNGSNNHGKNSSYRGHGNNNSNNNNMALDFSGFQRTADGKKVTNLKGILRQESKDEEPAIQEKDVLIVFELPDGSQGEKVFKYGHTIELLKSFVEGEYGIPMMEQCLYLDEKKLENPFSLLDYPEVKGCEEVFVRVEGNLPQFSKK